MPKKLDELIQLAKKHGWEVGDLDTEEIPGTPQTIVKAFTRAYSEHIVFGFVVGYGQDAETGRWRLLYAEDKYPANGILLYDEEIVGEYGWTAVSHIEKWLRNPDNLLEEAIAMPTEPEMMMTSVLARMEV